MADPLSYLKQRANDDWLLGYNSQEFFELVEQARQTLTAQQQTSPNPSPIILLAEPHPLKFLAHFLAACSTDCHLFLCNPNWAELEWQQVFELVQRPSLGNSQRK
ncbi:MAG: hypothetical protein HC866_00050 [Leptolyngbyaceae cyanobacterium RU_5_1]|nr:hypothetical protein [Leptolyngbyaceae cyanobacterium RU_5_1]